MFLSIPKISHKNLVQFAELKGVLHNCLPPVLPAHWRPALPVDPPVGCPGLHSALANLPSGLPTPGLSRSTPESAHTETAKDIIKLQDHGHTMMSAYMIRLLVAEHTHLGLGLGVVL